MRFSTRKFFLPLLCCLTISVIKCVRIPVAAAEPPTTHPAATQPANEPAADAPMRRWFARLADPDPKVRDQARVDLMGLSAADLPKLRQLVIDHQPILPGQASALHDIVVQAFLSSDTYKAMGDDAAAAGDGTDARGPVDTTITGKYPPYFLGIEWTNTLGDIEDARLGVTVEDRLPGFPGYRYLRTGDMILGVYMDPGVSLLQLPNMETHTHDQLKNAIKYRPDQQDIVLLILRDGEQMRIAVKLAPRPLKASDNLNVPPLDEFKEFKNDRANRADAYWQENFVPLLEERDAGESVE